MASTIVSRTQSGSESAAGRRTWTFSCWFKRNGLSASQELFGTDANGARSNNYNIIDFNSSDQLDFSGYESGTTFRKITNRKFRDTNAWYHLVIAFDTTQSTADDRIKIYINGVQETSFGTSTNPAQDHQSKFFSSGKIHAFGRSSQTFDGVISHCHATEGTAYAPTVFGSTDATTGEWKINTSPSVSYGTNGFFLFKNDNAVTNQARNSSGNFAVTAGTLTKTEDNPSNVFATGNPSYYFNGGHTFSNGNNTMYISGGWRSIISTLGTGTGKYYAEAKFVSIHSGSNNAVAGITALDGTIDNSIAQNLHGNLNTGSTYGLHNNGNFQAKSSYTINPYSASWTAGDIIGIAVDTENNKIYFSKNGSWQYSSDPSNGTNGVSIDANQNYGIGCSGYYNTMAMNYGNGYFGTTAVSSAGTNASGIGIFEYDVPTGYTALSTKGLNT